MLDVEIDTRKWCEPSDSRLWWQRVRVRGAGQVPFLLLLHLLEAPAEPGVWQGFELFARR